MSTGTPPAVAIDELARRLDDAWESGKTLTPLSESEGLTSPEVAYAIQDRWSRMRIARGDAIIGRKIGLTSKPMQEQMRVAEPDYGSVWASRYFPASGGLAQIPANTFIQPLAEAELAFLVGRPLGGIDVTPIEVLAATEAIAISVEIIDSRITDWRIQLADTIADNASYGGMTVGPWQPALRYADLSTLGMVVRHGGSPAVEAVGAAALGHPARSVAWLVNKLGSFGATLEPGDIVLSGSLGRSQKVRAGDVFRVESYGLPSLAVVFS